MSKANSKMITLAREARGLTQAALAKGLGVSQGSLSKVEMGQAEPTEELVSKLSSFLNYPKNFFYENVEYHNLPLTFFRKKKSISVILLKKITSRVNIQRFHISKLMQSVSVNSNEVPSINLEEYENFPEKVAADLRIQWHIPRGPIGNVTQVLENLGIIIVSCDFESNQIDGLSIFEKDLGLPPIIFVNRNISGDRLRFTLSHELAHIVLHHHLPLPSLKCENEADKFAAEFLMPSTEISGYLNHLNLDKLINLKPYWKVSMQAILMKASSLNKITDRQKTYLWMQMNKYGYRLNEPVKIDREEPSLLSKIINTHKNELEYDDNQLSNTLNLNLSEFNYLYSNEKNLKLINC